MLSKDTIENMLDLSLALWSYSQSQLVTFKRYGGTVRRLQSGDISSGQNISYLKSIQIDNTQKVTNPFIHRQLISSTSTNNNNVKKIPQWQIRTIEIYNRRKENITQHIYKSEFIINMANNVIYLHNTNYATLLKLQSHFATLEDSSYISAKFKEKIAQKLFRAEDISVVQHNGINMKLVVNAVFKNQAGGVGGTGELYVMFVVACVL